MAKKKQKHYQEQPAVLLSEKNSIKFKTGIIIFALLALVLFYRVFFLPASSADVISQGYPFGKYRINYFLKHFTLPLWFPYINGGVPELDVGLPFSISRVLTLLVFAFSPTYYGISYLITIILSGIFCFIYLKSKKIDDYAAFLASMIYMLSGGMISYFHPGHLKASLMALFPLILYLTDRGFELKKMIYFPLAGFLLGVCYMRHPQIFYYFGILFGFYYLNHIYFLAKNDKENRLKIIFNTVLWGVLLLVTLVAVASPTLFHQYFYVKFTSRGTLKSEVEMWNFATSWSHHPLELLTFFIPSLFGLYDSTYLGWKPFVQTTDYIGIITIFLMIIGIVVYWKKRHTKFFFISLIILLVFGFGKYFEIFYRIFVNYVPLIKKFRVPPSTYLIAALIIIYFAFWGLIAVFKAREDLEIKDKIKKVIVGMIVLLIIVSFWTYTDSYKSILMNNISPKNQGSDNSFKRQIAQIVQKNGWQQAEYAMSRVADQTINLAKKDLARMWLWVGLFLILYYFFVNGKIKKKTFYVLLTIIIFLDLYIVDKKFIQYTDNYDIVSKETSVIRFLKKDKEKFRILPFLSSHEANKWCIYKLESITGYHAAGIKIYEDIMKSGLLNNLSFVGLFNGKYIISQRLLNIPDLEEVFRDPVTQRIVYKNNKFLPRFFLADQYKVVENPEEVLNMLQRNEVDLSRTLILEDKPKLEKNVRLSLKDNEVTINQWHNDKIELKCKINNPCFLFLSEIYFPKWRAYIDKKEVKVYKTDYLFRSVFLDKGEYNLIFKYYNNGSYLITTLLHYVLSIIGIILIVCVIKKDR